MNGSSTHLAKRIAVSKGRMRARDPHLLRRFLDRAMYALGLISPLALIPQVLAIFATHETSNLSLLTWAAAGAINLCWALYGFLHKEYPILIANLVSAVLDLFIVAAILLY